MSTQRAKAMLDENENIPLSDRDRDIFLRLLDADPTPNAALEAAARRQREKIVFAGGCARRDVAPHLRLDPSDPPGKPAG